MVATISRLSDSNKKKRKSSYFLLLRKTSNVPIIASTEGIVIKPKLFSSIPSDSKASFMYSRIASDSSPALGKVQSSDHN